MSGTSERQEVGDPPAIERLWRASLFAAVAVYLAMTLVSGYASPGLQFDEALFQHGAVHMLRTGERPPFAPGRGSWIPVAGRYFPLMAIEYAGAAKSYLLLLPFAIAGSEPAVARVVSAVATAIGLLGVGLLVRRHVSAAAGAAVVLLLAINPSFIAFSLYDNTGMTLWFAITGLAAILSSRYLDHPVARNAFLLGASLGLGVWVRANFLWAIIAVVAALFLVAPSLAVSRWRHALAAACGGLAGGFPFLLYQIVSGGATLQVSRNLPKLDPVKDFVSRMYLLRESFLFPRERIYIWHGPAVPSWQYWTIASIVLASLTVCLLPWRADAGLRRWRLVTALALLFGIAITTGSSLPVKAHHYAGFLPLAAVVVVLAARRMLRSNRLAIPVVLALALLYGGISLSWNARAGIELRRTGGAWMWSDAISDVNDYLMKTPGKEITILDWGLTNNLYVLSSGRLRYVDRNTGENPDPSDWITTIRRGGVFLMNAHGNRNFPSAAEAFERDLPLAGVRFSRRTFLQKTGKPYAEVYEVVSSTDS